MYQISPYAKIYVIFCRMPTDTVYRGNLPIHPVAQPPPVPTTGPAPKKPPRQAQTDTAPGNDVTLLPNDLYEGVKDDRNNSNNNNGSVPLQDNELYEGSGGSPTQNGGGSLNPDEENAYES